MTTTDSLTVVTPELVTWMRGYLRHHKHGIEGTSKARAVRAWLDAHDYESLSQSPYHLRELADAYDEARRSPILTVADIPVGQGAASLFITEDDDGPAVWFRADNYDLDLIHRRVRFPEPGEAALWDLLAAHLPTVTTEEAS